MMHHVHLILFVVFLLVRAVSPVFGQEDEPQVYEPPRDYGVDWRPSVLLGLTPEDGVLVGGGPILYKFGFRRMPYVFRMQLTGGIALKTGAFKFEYTASYPALSERLSLDILGRASELEVRKFYGFGNDSRRDEALDKGRYYYVALREYQFRPTLFYTIAEGAKVGFGVFFKHVEARENPNRYVTAESLAVLGDDKSFVGESISFEVDMRNHPSASTSGWYLSMRGRNSHAFTKGDPFQKISAEARLFLTPPFASVLTLALRAGGEKLHGDFPFYEAAFLGGFGSLRGFNTERFAGDASLFGNADLRLSLFRMKILVPTLVGVFGFADAGRVWLHDASPGSWNVGVGGGISLAPLSPENTISLAVAHSKDGLFVVGGFGFGF